MGILVFLGIIIGYLLFQKWKSKEQSNETKMKSKREKKIFVQTTVPDYVVRSIHDKKEQNEITEFYKTKLLEGLVQDSEFRKCVIFYTFFDNSAMYRKFSDANKIGCEITVVKEEDE